ncbi:MAG: aspartate:alanine exchanger family transporter [Candidatus Hydrogenedentota bacterium]
MQALLSIAASHNTGAAMGEMPGAENLFDLLLHNPVTSVFAIIGLGMLLGSIKVYGISLGSSGVIFVAIAFGALGAEIPQQLGSYGLVLFVYCIGLTAGPGFFRAFRRQGAQLARLSLVIVAAGMAVTALFAYLADVPAEVATGVFAGALTSTPGLAAGLSVLSDSPAVSIGYGIAYPFGVIGVVLFVQLLPRLLRRDLDKEAQQAAQAQPGEKTIARALIEVRNPSVFGKPLDAVRFVRASHCQISRVLKDGHLVPVTPETTFEEGQLVLAVGYDDHLEVLADFLGCKSERPYLLDTEAQRMKVVATSEEVVGKRLRELNLINRFGITISRIVRNDIGFVPEADTMVQRADVLYAVGEPAQLKAFAAFAGHRTRVLDETDLVSLSVGIILGVIIGKIPIALPGSEGFTLGMAGGPLLVALVLGHFGGIGRLRGHMPRAARLLMMEIGLVFFLAHAGVRAGLRFGDVFQEYGPLLLIMGALVTTVPMAAGFLYARFRLGLDLLQTLGGTCGSMTSTPGLGAITSKTDSELPAISYAAAYPVALILMTLFTQLLVEILT